MDAVSSRPKHLTVQSVSMDVVRFCAEEVRRQGRGPVQVAWMVEAWAEAQRSFWQILAEGRAPQGASDIQNWGHRIEREKNPDYEWRDCGVRVGATLCPPPDMVPAYMEKWLTHFPDMSAGEAYLEFERIHPFRDGNGRVGKIIFNWKNATLDAPVFPPDFFGGIVNP